ncbi:MAG: glycosyltransferase [Bacillota bacterium]
MEKKIVLVDHSFHMKTKSSQFIIDLLKERYDVEIIWDTYWKDGIEADLSFVDESHYAVVFWQSLLPVSLKNLTCKNIVFFPMYDACCSLGADYWYSIRHVKIMNFSKTLFLKLKGFGFQTMYAQFFPPPVCNNGFNDLSLFFWNRTNDVTWRVVKKIIQNADVSSIHIHKAIDPFYDFIAPSAADERKYHITYSDWFASRDDYLGAVKNKSIYIAPRRLEGLGFSFLEAMAMGRAVVAADNPTMNEYIRHGVNGYLFSLKYPRPIDFGNLRLIQRNAFHSIAEGRKKWEAEKDKIYEFIELEPVKNFIIEKKYKHEVALSILLKAIKKIILYIMPYGIVRLYQRYIKRHPD